MSPATGRFVTDEQGHPTAVIISIQDYERMLSDLEELASIRAYDAAKASGEEAIPFSDAVREIESKK